MKWMYDGHREAMKQAVAETWAVNKTRSLSREYAAALYLLTGMESAWPRLKQYANRDGIDHYRMLDEPLSYAEQLIVGLSGNLFNGGTYVDFAPIEFIDHLDDELLELAINGIKLRRGKPTMAMLEETPM